MSRHRNPEEGDIIQYRYLWNHEREAGREHGKVRPCLVVRAGKSKDGKHMVEVAPITRRLDIDPKINAKRGVEVRGRDRDRLSRSEDRSRVITDDVMRFRCPSEDLAPPPPGKGYVKASADLLKQVKERVRQHERDGSLKRADREAYDRKLERLAEHSRGKSSREPSAFERRFGKSKNRDQQEREIE